MNWYKTMQNVLAAALRGEWWIDESGSAHYADGDVGDMNHEAHVIETIRGRYASDEFTGAEYVDWDGYKKFLYEEWLNLASSNPSLAQPYVTLQNPVNSKELHHLIDTQSDPDQIVHDLLLQEGMTEEEISIADGRNVDTRMYAMKNWGWKRVQGSNIETWTLSDRDLSSIASGIYDAFGSNGLEEEEDQIDRTTFNIWVGANQKWFRDVPYYVISSRNLSALREYADAQFSLTQRNRPSM